MNRDVSEKTVQPSTDSKQSPKFVSDDDIVGRSDWLQRGLRRPMGPSNRKPAQPTFLSDEDIVRRPEAA
jgi:hypothetical protein